MLTSPSGKRYIGQTKNIVKARVQQHFSDKTKSNAMLVQRAVRKHGKDTFKVETLLEISNNMLDEYEVKFISAYDTIAPRGYNVATTMTIR